MRRLDWMYPLPANGIAAGMRVERKSASDRRRSRSRIGLVLSVDIPYASVRWDTGMRGRVLLSALQVAGSEASE